jgi:hypothetical protein
MDSDAGGYPNPPEAGGHHGLLMFVLVVALAAILAAGAALGMYLAKQRDAGQRANVRKSIYKVVRRAIDKALQARGPELLLAAATLVKVLTRHLSPFLGLGKPIFSAIEAVERALSGKAPGPPKAPGAPSATPASSTASSTPSISKEGSTVVVTPSVVTNINLVSGSGSDGKSVAAQPPPPAMHDMTLPEQFDALTKAIDALDRAWQPEKVDAFLLAAQTALLEVHRDDDDLHEVRGGRDSHGGH